MKASILAKLDHLADRYEEVGALLSDLIDHRRRNPEGVGQGEVLEALIFGEFEGRRLDQQELIQNCIFLLNAGHETTTSLMANGLGVNAGLKFHHWPE